MSESEQRKKTVNKQIRMTPEEADEIEARAAAFGVSLPQYMRDCAMDRPLRSAVDFRAVKTLARLNADQGRLGGLLKKWLTGDWQLADGFNGDVGALLREIAKVQTEIRVAIKTLASVKE